MKNYSFKVIFLLFLLIVGLQVHAYEFQYQGIYYNVLEDGKSVEVTNDSWGKYSGTITIPETVTNNEVESNSESGNVKSFTVVGIGPYAFRSCFDLESVSLPETLSYIGEGAFTFCYGLESILLPSSLLTIGAEAFFRCKSLTNIKIPDGVTKIDYSTFSGCESLQEVELPSSIETIEDFAFVDCVSIISIDLPENVRKISAKVFLGCSFLARITVSTKNPYLSSNNGFVTNKKGDELIICPPGKANGDLTLPSGIEKIADGAFSETNLETITLPETLEEIGEGAFGACEKLKIVNFPASLKVIGAEAFDLCLSLRRVIFPKNSQLTHILAEGFENCYNLEYVDLPASLEKVEGGAFEDCDRLKTIICRAVTPPSLDDETFNYGENFNPYTYADVYVPEESVEAYKSAYVWSRFPKINAFEVEAERIDLNKEEITLTEGKSFKLTATVYPEDTKDKTVIWNSDNEEVATVSEDGNIKAIKKGYALITAICGNAKAYCVVTVKYKPTKINIIEADRETITMIVGETLQLGATTEPEDASTEGIVWESSDPEVASVDQEGLVTALSPGGTQISISYEDLSAYCWIKVIADAGVESIIAVSDSIVTVYSMDGLIVKKDCNVGDLHYLPKGIYIIVAGNRRFKIHI